MGFALLLMLCIGVPLLVALLFLALLIYSNRPEQRYDQWVRGAAQNWRNDEETIRSVRPRKVPLTTILADAVPVDEDPLGETRVLIGNARIFMDAGKQRARSTRVSLKNRTNRAKTSDGDNDAPPPPAR